MMASRVQLYLVRRFPYRKMGCSFPCPETNSCFCVVWKCMGTLDTTSLALLLIVAISRDGAVVAR